MRRPESLSGHVYIIGSVSFHPDGDLLATVSLDGNMKLWDVASGEEIEMMPYSSPVAALTFSQDSETLIYCGEKRRTERYNLVTGETESILPAVSGSYKSLDFGANGSLLAVTNSGQITIYDTDTGEVELSFGGQYNDATFSNDDNTLVVLTGLGPRNLVVRAILRDIRTWEVMAEIPMTNIFSSKVELSNESRILAVLASDEIQIWDVATRRVESVLPNNGGGKVDPAKPWQNKPLGY